MSEEDNIGIVLIDDSFIDRTIVKKNMELFYPDVPFVAYSSGSEALRIIAQGEKPLSNITRYLVLLDIYMPEMNGFQFVDAFNELDDALKAPFKIVMLSSSIDDRDMANVKSRPTVERFISKPLNETLLKSVLEETLQLFDSKED